ALTIAKTTDTKTTDTKTIVVPTTYGEAKYELEALDREKIFQRFGHSPHIDFIIGRGTKEPKNYLNIPLSSSFCDRNVVYIDPEPSVCANVKLLLEDVDFSS